LEIRLGSPLEIAVVEILRRYVYVNAE